MTCTLNVPPCIIKFSGQTISRWLMISLQISILLISFSVNAQTDVYHPFPENNAMWRESMQGLGSSCTCSGNVCVREDEYQYIMNGDTTINGQAYKKIYQSGSITNYIAGPYQCPPGYANYHVSYYNSYLSHFLREDKAQRKVYTYAFNQEQLLYDFNLTTGDTLAESYNSAAFLNYVSSIDSVLVGGIYHRRFRISSDEAPDYVAIIEGIGSTWGLFTMLSPPFETNHKVRCVTVDSVTVFPDAGTPCDLVSGINEVNGRISFSISPNPFHSFTTVTFDPGFQNAELTVVNLVGEKVKELVVSSSSVNISRDELPNGIYFIHVQDKLGRTATRKIIIE